MKLKETFLIALIFFFIANQFVFTQGNSEKERKEIGYFMLYLEKEAGFDIGNAYQILDSMMFFSEVALKPLVKDWYSKEEAVEVLRSIGIILKISGFKLSGILFDSSSFCSSICEKKFDCDVGTILYLTIAQRFNLPLFGINIGYHMFINWKDENLNFNWETLDNSESIEHFTFYDTLNTFTIKSYGYFIRGNTKYLLKDYEGAMKDYDKAIEINPKFTTAYGARGKLYFELMNFEGALEDHNKAIGINPEFVQAYVTRSLIKIGQNNYEGAIEDCDKAIELFPKLLEFAPEYNQFLGNAYFCRGFAKAKLTNFKKAIEDYDRGLEINSEDAVAYSMRGWCKSMLADFLGAIEDYDKAIAINPNYVETFIRREKAKNDLKIFNEKIEKYNNILKQEPNNVNILFNKGYTLYLNERYDEAIKCFKKTIELNPDNRQIFYNISSSYSLLKNKKEMLINLKKAIIFNNNDKQAAKNDKDFEEYWNDTDFIELTK